MEELYRSAYSADYIKTPDPNPELEAKLKELSEKYGDFNSLPDDKRNLSVLNTGRSRENIRSLQLLRMLLTILIMLCR